MAGADATRLELVAPRRARRSHAERRAATRSKIIAAVVESIAEVGFQGTTAAEITRRSGVTWGAVQHHFGDKDGLLTAVLEESFNRFAERIEEIPIDDTSLDERARMFVERAWGHFSSRYYYATFEILMVYMRRADGDGDQGADGAGPGSGWQERMTRAWDGVWSRVFADASIDRRRSLMLQRYTVSVLAGLASTLALAGAGATRVPVEGELGVLAATLRRELSGGVEH